jgi:hypothetical protein
MQNFNIGDKYETSFYGEIEIINYINKRKIFVRFSRTGYERETTGEQIISGSVKDRLAKTVCGVGYIGDGRYTTSYRLRKPYHVWRCMLARCYMNLPKHKAYHGCTVVEDWHNFQNFAAWFDDNYPEEDLRYELDKDILKKGNKVYGPETCIFVTKKENLSAKSKNITLMNGVTGEVFHFESVISAAKATGISTASISRLVNERRGRFTSDGWFSPDWQH